MLRHELSGCLPIEDRGAKPLDVMLGVVLALLKPSLCPPERVPAWLARQDELDRYVIHVIL